MPPRYSYWTILAGGLPTAFRAAEREELLPTFQQLKRKHADAELRWFARGRLWVSPEEAKAASTTASTPPRGRNWRPGGRHEDPRQPFKDAKKERNQRVRRERFDRRSRDAAGSSPPAGNRPAPSFPERGKRSTFRGRPAHTSSRPPRRDQAAHRPGKPRR